MLVFAVRFQKVNSSCGLLRAIDDKDMCYFNIFKAIKIIVVVKRL